MADFWTRPDITGTTAFADGLIEFGFEADEQLVINEGMATVELSWDGQAVHGTLLPSGPTSAINWSDHKRRKLYLRKVASTGSPGGPNRLQVYASTK